MNLNIFLFRFFFVMLLLFQSSNGVKRNVVSIPTIEPTTEIHTVNSSSETETNEMKKKHLFYAYSKFKIVRWR